MTAGRPPTIALAIAVGLAPAIAVADPEDDTPEQGPVSSSTDPQPREPTAIVEPGKPAQPSDEHTAAEVDDAPVPGHESGVVAGSDGGDSAARVVARGLLFVPRAALELAFAPVRGGIWAESKYHLYDRAHAVLFDSTNTYGIYPTGRFESDFGINAGARFVHRDLLGHHEHLSVFGGGGGRFREIGAVNLGTGDLFGDLVSIDAEAVYEKRPKDAFWGIGNGDLADGTSTPIDPRTDDSAVGVRYRQRIERVAGVADVHVVGGLHLRGTEALTDLELGRSAMGPPIDEVYMPSGLVGFDGGVRHLYSELELRWDDRGRASKLEPPSIYALGGLTGIYVGHTHRLDGGPDYWRVGFDVQQMIRLAAGPKVLLLRAHGEGVGGGIGDVPFTDLPALGGSRFLRGYPLDRFRDRVAFVGSAEYQWDLLRALQAGLFVDGGRVYDTVHHLSFDRMRMGYGATIQWFGENSLWLRATVASSIDGGIEMYLSFDPVTDLDRRVERR